MTNSILGGHAATEAGLQGGRGLLDPGSGLGGPAHYFAGGDVKGIDLTDESVKVARSLTRRLGMEEKSRPKMPRDGDAGCPRLSSPAKAVTQGQTLDLLAWIAAFARTTSNRERRH
ncbi:MAG: hypothetical protein J2P48_10945 [Alphaproteobacteria bacterium]|nr:hypothetical protein [Alphaproteobacteria bacterium]